MRRRQASSGGIERSDPKPPDTEREAERVLRTECSATDRKRCSRSPRTVSCFPVLRKSIVVPKVPSFSVHVAGPGAGAAGRICAKGARRFAQRRLRLAAVVIAAGLGEPTWFTSC